MDFKKLPLTLAVTGALALTGASAQAIEVAGIDLTGSGFLTLGAGKMLGGSKGEASDYKRPFFVADYAQAGIYNGTSGLQFKPDSKLGVQGTATLPGSGFSVTGQLVARGARDGNVNLEWLYASYKVNDQWTFQAGRKRIPMFFYSETQDVGLTLPWTHLPGQLYGWEAVNYNGANLSYQGQWGNWSSAINLVAGNEGKNESGYWKVYRGKNNRTDVRWDDILGGDLSLSKDWLETRFVYLQSKVRQKNVSGSWDANPDSPTYGQLIGAESDFTTPANRQQIYGVSFNIDYHNFLVRSESIYINHNQEAGYKDHAQILGLGYRFGKITPMLTVSDYRSQAIVSSGAESDAQEAHRTTSLTLRYDLTPSSDIKVQFDSQKDRSGPNYTIDGYNRFGNARLLTATYDMVF